VPAAQFGLRQQIEVGPMSGKSNVIYWLESRGIDATDERVARIYEKAKSAAGVLSEEEVMALV
jgi:2-isopropylmalate synthase